MFVSGGRPCDPAQQSAEQIGPGDYAALALDPDQDQILVNDVVARLVRLHGKPVQHLAQGAVGLAYHQRAMAERERIERGCVEQRGAQQRRCACP